MGEQRDGMVSLGDILAAVPGLSQRQLDSWTRRRYLTAVEGGGSGRTRWYPRREMAVAWWMQQLVAVGVTPQAASGLARVAASAAGPLTVQLADDLELRFLRGVEPVA